MINKILILLLASSLLNITKAVLAVSIVFAALRVWAGGFHFKNYTVCAYFTVVTLLITGWLVTVLPYNTLVSNIILSTLFVTITLYAPVENSNHPIREQDKNKHKQFALFTILILFWLKSCINDTLIQQAAIGGSLLATITALPIINKFVERGRKNVIVGVKNQV
jgi:accessory gene regulator protein AgrB